MIIPKHFNKNVYSDLYIFYNRKNDLDSLYISTEILKFSYFNKKRLEINTSTKMKHLELNIRNDMTRNGKYNIKWEDVHSCILLRYQIKHYDLNKVQIEEIFEKLMDMSNFHIFIRLYHNLGSPQISNVYERACQIIINSENGLSCSLEDLKYIPEKVALDMMRYINKAHLCFNSSDKEKNNMSKDNVEEFIRNYCEVSTYITSSTIKEFYDLYNLCMNTKISKNQCWIKLFSR